jgi:hypothetical protein
MFGYRWSAVSLLKALAMALALALAATAVAKADPCDDARKAFDAIDPNVAKAVRMAERIVFNDDPADRQKAVCEERKVRVEIERELVRRKERVDQACGARIRWEKCDTACAREELRKTQRDAAHECDPARIPEAVRKAQQEKEEKEEVEKKLNEESRRMSDNAGACMHATMADKSDVSKPQWPAWIKGCNESDRDICTNAWFTLEGSGIPTTGLTCRPNAQERANRKRIDDEMNSPQHTRQVACASLASERGRKAPQHDEWVKLCNAAPAEDCSVARSIIEDDNKMPNPGLTCEKPDMGGWK